MPGSDKISPPTTRRSAGTTVINRSTRNTRSARKTDKFSGRGHERDTHDEKVEHAPRIAEESEAVHRHARRNLDHEDRQDHGVKKLQRRAGGVHDGRAGFEPEDGRVHKNKSEYDPFRTRVGEDGA